MATATRAMRAEEYVGPTKATTVPGVPAMETAKAVADWPRYTVVRYLIERGKEVVRVSPFYGHRTDAFEFAIHHYGEVWVDYGKGNGMAKVL